MLAWKRKTATTSKNEGHHHQEEARVPRGTTRPADTRAGPGDDRSRACTRSLSGVTECALVALDVPARRSQVGSSKVNRLPIAT